MKPTNRTAVERVVDVFITNMTPQSALDVDDFRCVYSAQYNGFGCAIGCLFSDDNEAERCLWDKHELTYIADIVNEFEQPREHLAQCDIKLLDALQRWHDYCLNDEPTQAKRASLMRDAVLDFAPRHLPLVEEVLDRCSTLWKTSLTL
jgi:hypothetical protein